MKRSAIIVAGGMGRRMGGPIPKQFMLLGGKPLLCHTIAAFHAFDPAMRIIVVLPEEQIAIWHTLCIGHHFDPPHEVVAGGKERFRSVLAGFGKLSGEGVVAIHDGARPLASADLIARCFQAAEAHGSGIPVVPVTSSVRKVEGPLSRAVDRTELRAVQTPQCFRMEILLKAFEQPYDPAFTDEATVVERSGVAVHLVDGEEANIKVTTPLDLRVAEVLLAAAR